MPSVEEQKEAPVVPENSKAVPTLDAGVAEPGKNFAVSKRSLDLGEKNSTTLIYGSCAAVLAAIVGIFALSHREIPGTSKPTTAQNKAAPVQHKPGTPIPTDKAQAANADDAGRGDVTADDLENTKGHSANSVLGSNQPTNEEKQSDAHRQDSHTGRATSGVPASHAPLGSIQPFQQPQYAANRGQAQFQPAPYQGTVAVPYAGGAPVSSGTTTEMMREYAEQVSKPSLIFTSQATAAKPTAGIPGQLANSITNFGLEPGFHVAAHLESAVSTFGNVPAVAIIEYNYIRNGQILIPAGSRVVGRLAGGSATGVVSLAFTEIYLPDGSRVPISAVGLDPTLKPIKGKVTGRNTGKAFLLASITSVGSLGAGFLGTGNSSAVTQESLARDQISSNIGRAGDQAVQNMVVNSQLVVTVPSGTLIEVTFTTPARTGVAGIEPTSTTSTNR